MYCCRPCGNRRIDCDPLQGGTIWFQHLIPPDERYCRNQGVAARQVGTMTPGFGMRSVGVFWQRRGRGGLRSVAGMPAKNRGGHFTARKHCRGEPEHHPSHYQPHARESAQTPWPSGLRHPGRTLRRRQHMDQGSASRGPPACPTSFRRGPKKARRPVRRQAR